MMTQIKAIQEEEKRKIEELDKNVPSTGIPDLDAKLAEIRAKSAARLEEIDREKTRKLNEL